MKRLSLYLSFLIMVLIGTGSAEASFLKGLFGGGGSGGGATAPAQPQQQMQPQGMVSAGQMGGQQMSGAFAQQQPQGMVPAGQMGGQQRALPRIGQFGPRPQQGYPSQRPGVQQNPSFGGGAIASSQYPQQSSMPPALPGGRALLENSGQYAFARVNDKLQILKTETVAVPVEFDLDEDQALAPETSSGGASRIIKVFDPSVNRTRPFAEDGITVPFSELLNLRIKLGRKVGNEYIPERAAPTVDGKLEEFKQFFFKAFGYYPMEINNAIIVLNDVNVDESDTDPQNEDEYNSMVVLPKVFIPLAKKREADSETGDPVRDMYRTSVDLPGGELGGPRKKRGFWEHPTSAGDLISPNQADVDGLDENTKKEFLEMQGEIGTYSFNQEDFEDAEGWLKLMYAASKGIKPNAFAPYTKRQVKEIGHKILALFNPPDQVGRQGDNPDPIQESYQDGWSNFVAKFLDDVDAGKIRTRDSGMETTTPRPQFPSRMNTGGIAQSGMGARGIQGMPGQQMTTVY